MPSKRITIRGVPVRPPSFRHKQRQDGKGAQERARRGKQGGGLRGSLGEEAHRDRGERPEEAWVGMGKRSGERNSGSWSPPPLEV